MLSSLGSDYVLLCWNTQHAYFRIV